MDGKPAPAVLAFTRLAQGQGAESFVVESVTNDLGVVRWIARAGWSQTPSTRPEVSGHTHTHTHILAVGEDETEAADACASLVLYQMKCHLCGRDVVGAPMWTDLMPFDWCVWQRAEARWRPRCTPVERVVRKPSQRGSHGH